MCHSVLRSFSTLLSKMVTVMVVYCVSLIQEAVSCNPNGRTLSSLLQTVFQLLTVYEAPTTCVFEAWCLFIPKALLDGVWNLL